MEQQAAYTFSVVIMRGVGYWCMRNGCVGRSHFPEELCDIKRVLSLRAVLIDV